MIEAVEHAAAGTIKVLVCHQVVGDTRQRPTAPPTLGSTRRRYSSEIG